LRVPPAKEHRGPIALLPHFEGGQNAAVRPQTRIVIVAIANGLCGGALAVASVLRLVSSGLPYFVLNGRDLDSLAPRDPGQKAIRPRLSRANSFDAGAGANQTV
jgi:hypothetical protein